MGQERLGNSMIDSFSEEYFFLSNFYDSVVKFDGDSFRTVEHAYQAAKTLDEESRNKIRDAKSPGKAKRLGQKVDLRKDWESIKINVMRDLLKQKFNPRSVLAERLLKTGDEQLVEGNDWGDKFWGVVDGKGANHLGYLLMEIRNDLKEYRARVIAEDLERLSYMLME